MKKHLFLIAVLIGLNAGVRADSLQVTESWTDKIVTVRDPDFGSFPDVQSTSKSTLMCSFTVPGLDVLSAGDWGNLNVSLSLGNLSISGTLSEANTFSATKAVFVQTDFDDKGNEVQVGRLTFSRAGNVLTVSGQSKITLFAGNYLDAEGSISDQAQCDLSLGDFSISRPVYLKGKNTITERTVGSGDEAEEFFLNNIQLTGTAHFTKPTVTFHSPAAGARLTNDTV